MIKLIVGLGNPSSKYKETRHNIGFQIIDQLAKELDFPPFQSETKFKGLIADKDLEKQKIILLKPTTFMNNSGESVSALLNFYKIPLESLLIIHDDFDLQLGEIKIRQNATGKSTHNGIRSIVEHLGSPSFSRLRFGIGSENPLPKDVFVLQKFEEEELEIVSQKIKEALIIIKKFI